MMKNNLTFNSASVPKSKKEQALMASALVGCVLDGEVNPIQYYVQARSLMEILKQFSENPGVKACVLSEMEKYGKSVDMFGARLDIRETACRTDYSGCGDIVYNRLIEQKEELDKKIKEREASLKVLSSSRTEVDEETGEVFTIYPPARSSVTSFAVTFKKE